MKTDQLKEVPNAENIVVNSIKEANKQFVSERTQASVKPPTLDQKSKPHTATLENAPVYENKTVEKATSQTGSVKLQDGNGSASKTKHYPSSCAVEGKNNPSEPFLKKATDDPDKFADEPLTVKTGYTGDKQRTLELVQQSEKRGESKQKVIDTRKSENQLIENMRSENEVFDKIASTKEGQNKEAAHKKDEDKNAVKKKDRNEDAQKMDRKDEDAAQESSEDKDAAKKVDENNDAITTGSENKKIVGEKTENNDPVQKQDEQREASPQKRLLNFIPFSIPKIWNRTPKNDPKTTVSC